MHVVLIFSFTMHTIDNCVHDKLMYVGSGFQSYSSYLGGYVSTRIKLVPGYSAGVVVAYYVSVAKKWHWLHIAN